MGKRWGWWEKVCCAVVYEKEDAEKVLLAPYTYYTERPELRRSVWSCVRCQARAGSAIAPQLGSSSVAPTVGATHPFRGIAFQHYSDSPARMLSLDPASWDPEARVLWSDIAGVPGVWSQELDETASCPSTCVVLCARGVVVPCCAAHYRFQLNEDLTASDIALYCNGGTCCLPPCLALPRFCAKIQAVQTDDDPHVWRRETTVCPLCVKTPHIYNLKFALTYDNDGHHIRTKHWDDMIHHAPRYSMLVR